MKRKIRIAFDLDGVIADKPPLIPKQLLEWLFRGGKPRGKELYYRFPDNKLEQFVRKLSHFYLFRPPIKKNIKFIENLARDDNFELYIISGRYSFLQTETARWLEKRKMKHFFKEIFLNLRDEQPHLFKENKLRAIKADFFMDDDGPLADYLAKNVERTKIYCFSQSQQCGVAQKISDLNDLLS